MAKSTSGDAADTRCPAAEAATSNRQQSESVILFVSAVNCPSIVPFSVQTYLLPECLYLFPQSSDAVQQNSLILVFHLRGNSLESHRLFL